MAKFKKNIINITFFCGYYFYFMKIFYFTHYLVLMPPWHEMGQELNAQAIFLNYIIVTYILLLLESGPRVHTFLTIVLCLIKFYDLSVLHFIRAFKYIIANFIKDEIRMLKEWGVVIK